MVVEEKWVKEKNRDASKSTLWAQPGSWFVSLSLLLYAAWVVITAVALESKFPKSDPKKYEKDLWPCTSTSFKAT